MINIFVRDDEYGVELESVLIGHSDMVVSL